VLLLSVILQLVALAMPFYLQLAVAEMGGVASTGVVLAVEYGVLGAEAGALAGPVGVLVGVSVGAVAGYAIYEYGPEAMRSVEEIMNRYDTPQNVSEE
jgi:hypothetical protein